jgi:phosphohistidine phosphatase
MRHAKAESFAASDRERALTRRGAADAAAAGEYLRAQGLVPDHVLVSPAKRARESWEALEASLRSGVEPRFDEAVYGGSPDRLIEALQATPVEATTVLFVGHQPDVGLVAHLLDDGHGEPAAVQRMLEGYPTSAAAVLGLAVPWEHLGEARARLLDFHTPR